MDYNPYIDPREREWFDIPLNLVPEIKTKGQLEYCIFKLMKKFMSTKEFRYSTLHDCVYGCIHAGEEFRRRFLDKREDEALEKNGDIK